MGRQLPLPLRDTLLLDPATCPIHGQRERLALCLLQAAHFFLPWLGGKPFPAHHSPPIVRELLDSCRAGAPIGRIFNRIFSPVILFPVEVKDARNADVILRRGAI